MNRTVQPNIQELKGIHLLPVSRHIFPNGIPATIVYSDEQDIVRIDFLFKGGYWTQQQKLQAMMTNCMLREGTRNYSSNKIAETFDYYGSSLELSVLSQYSCVTAYSLNKYYEPTIRLLKSILCEPIFPEKELKVLLNSEKQRFIINNSRTRYITTRNLRTALYGLSHPMGNLAEEEDYNVVEPNLLKQYFDQHYSSTNCHIFISGNVKDDILKLTEDIFGSEGFGNNHKIVCSSYSSQTDNRKRIFIEKEDAKQSSIKLGMLTVDIKHPDYLKLNILVTILGGYFGSRLMSNIREDKGYTYGIFSTLLAEPDSSTFLIASEANGNFVEPLIQEVYKEITRLQEEKVSEEELTLVRNYMTGTLCRNLEVSFNVADLYEMLFFNELDDNYPMEKLNAIRSVTAEELQLLARRYLCKENLKEVISGKK